MEDSFTSPLSPALPNWVKEWEFLFNKNFLWFDYEVIFEVFMCVFIISFHIQLWLLQTMTQEWDMTKTCTHVTVATRVLFLSFLSFLFSSVLAWVAEYELRADMMFPCSGHGLLWLLTVIYFSLSIAPSLPLRRFVEWCANPLYSSDKCIDQYKQTGGHKPKWKP